MIITIAKPAATASVAPSALLTVTPAVTSSMKPSATTVLTHVAAPKLVSINIGTIHHITKYIIDWIGLSGNQGVAMLSHSLFHIIPSDRKILAFFLGGGD